MIFIGQKHIWEELSYIIPELQRGKNVNIIIRAPSGCGKTKLAIILANFISENHITYYIPDDDGRLDFEPTTRIIIIDEIHTLTQPEILYPFMDSGNHIFILCSNEFGELKEPLVNRCIDLNFEEYNTAEIAEIINHDFLAMGIRLTNDVLREIASNCNGVPRIARQVTQRLSFIFNVRGIPETVEEVRDVLINILQIENGLNVFHRKYLDFLQKTERASLDLISFATRIDKKTIQKEIEPILLQRGLISITSRGRKLNVS